MKDLEELMKKLNLSDFTTETIKLLMKKKTKEISMGRMLNFFGLMSIGMILFMTGYIYWKIEEGTNFGGSALSFILSDLVLLLIIVALFFLLSSIYYYKQKFDKAEKDVDKIREDLIDRHSEFWNTPELESKRYQLLKFLKEKKDINLFHK